MYSEDGYYDSDSSFNAVKNDSLVVMPLSHAECKSELNVNVSNISGNKESDEAPIISWNEDYSQRLAIFKKNSSNLLENISKKPQHINSFNDRISFNTSESPINTLIELEEKSQLNDSKNKFNKTVEISRNSSTNIKDRSNFDERGNNSESGKTENEAQKKSVNTKHNFQEALRIDDLENQLNKLQKQVKEKDKIIKDLQSELQCIKQVQKVPIHVIHRNLATEFNNDFYSSMHIKEKKTINPTTLYDQKINCHLKSEEFSNHNENSNSNHCTINKDFINNQEDNASEYSSIKDYNPNNPTALKNKIKDLESQIQDLQEANEMASLLVSSVRNNKIEESYIDSNEIFSELLVRNQTLEDEVQKLRQNATLVNTDLLSSKFLRKELENLKQDLFTLKEHNNMMTNENTKLKNIIKSECFSDNDQNDKKNYKKRKQTNIKKQNKITDDLIKTDDVFIERESMLEKSIKSMNNNCVYERDNIELSTDSTNSILSGVNKEIEEINFMNNNHIKPFKSKEIQNTNNKIQDKFTTLNDGGCEYLESNNYELLNKSKKYISNLNKFSTLGRTAFAPRSGTDININDVVKFIRQGGRISKGLVHFIGHLPKRNDIYLGIELEIEDGKHDGIYEGNRYFQCRENKGVFVAFNKIIMVYSKNIDR